MPRRRRNISAASRAAPITAATSGFLLLILCLCLENHSSIIVTALIGEQIQLTKPYDRSRIGRRRTVGSTTCFYAADNPLPSSASSGSNNSDPVDYLEEKEDDSGDGNNDDENFSSLGFSGDYAQESLLQVCARDRKWLEKATDDIMDEEQYPIGELSQDDIDSITGLMIAWVRRRSIQAGLAVERLLVRVVADMRANNPVAQTTARMYALAMDAWAKSGVTGSAERAQHIHDTLIQFYAETGDEALRPTTASYNILINAHGKSSDASGLDNAEQVLKEMIDSEDERRKPDSVSFSTLLDSYAKSSDPTRVERTLKLLKLMDELNIERNAYTYTALQNVYASSRQPDAADMTMKVLEEMVQLYEEGNPVMKPSVANYNAVLAALSRTVNGTKNANVANNMIRKMMQPREDGGYDVDPDKLSFALAILTCSRCPTEIGTAKAEELLLCMEARAMADEKKREEVSSAAPPSVALDLESFNLVLVALSKTRSDSAVQRMIDIIGRMKKYAEDGHTEVAPTVRSWNALLNAISRSNGAEKIDKAEQIIDWMYSLHEGGVSNVKPDAYSYAALLTAYSRSETGDPAQIIQGMENTLNRMQTLYEDEILDAPPDVFHYTILISALGKSGLPSAADRAMQILAHMTNLAAEGMSTAKPNVRTFQAVLDCLARSGKEGEAERLLDHMMVMDRQGEKCVDSFCFDSVISAFCRSKRKGSGSRAESVLDRLLDYSEENPSCKPKARSFKLIQSHYRTSREPDAPYRSEYLLQRQISLFKAGHLQLQPDNLSFKLVLDTYAGAKHPDSGVKADQLLKEMRDLQQKHKATKICIDSSVMYCVLYAWVVSGHADAGRRAEIHLDDMERKYESGDENLKPDSRLYGLVLNAWAKSSSFEKAQRANNVLMRMEKQQQNGNEDVHPNEHCHSLVINACAFTNSGQEAEREAFRIAVTTFNKMLASSDCQPSSLAYGWFIQACGRLKVPESERYKELERTWKLCCKNGLVNAFVLHRFTGSAPESLYFRLLAPVIRKLGLSVHNETKEIMKFKINPSDFPREWTQNCESNNTQRSDKASADWWNTAP